MEITFNRGPVQCLIKVFSTFDKGVFNVRKRCYPTFDKGVIQRLTMVLSNV